jgi:hypothetical protein
VHDRTHISPERRGIVIRKSSPGWLILHGHATLNGIEKLQALTVDSHPLDTTHALVQDSPLGNYLLCEQHKLQHTTSIVSISTYAVTYACIKLSEEVFNSDGTGPEIEFLEWTWLIWPDLLVASLQHIGRNTHCEPSLFHPGTDDSHDCTSTVLQDSGRSYHRKSALQRRFKTPVGTNLPSECRMSV